MGGLSAGAVRCCHVQDDASSLSSRALGSSRRSMRSQVATVIVQATGVNPWMYHHPEQ